MPAKTASSEGNENVTSHGCVVMINNLTMLSVLAAGCVRACMYMHTHTPIACTHTHTPRGHLENQDEPAQEKQHGQPLPHTHTHTHTRKSAREIGLFAAQKKTLSPLPFARENEKMCDF
jgi:hypothetical protein